MKDLSTNILTAVKTALANITYNSETIQVFDMQPGSALKRYILINDLSFSDALTQDQNIANCVLEIEVVIKAQYYQGVRTALNSVSDSVLTALIKKKLTITSGAMTVTPFLRSATMTRQYEGTEIVLSKILTVEFNVEET
jgi:hypothetical protein